MTGPLRILVADDEPLARRGMRRMIEAICEDATIAECGSGDELVDQLARVDVVLLDVQMPGRSVFDVLVDVASRDTQTLPAVVFTTAYERYAVRAFEVNAVDYLVKPIARERLAEAIGRARRRVTDRAGADAVAGVARDLGTRPARVLVPDRGRMVPIEVAAIDWIQAEGDYARIHSAGRSYLVPRGISDLERRLDAARFLRIHRSALVNAERIREVRAEGSGRHSLLLADGTRLVVSRRHADRVRNWRI